MALTPGGAQQKGKDAERKICTDLNAALNIELMERSLPVSATPIFQRRQNQSAVGGDDIENPFRLSIEVKAQETLAVNTWWSQCIASAKRSEGMPILLYKQNRIPYKAMMYGKLYVSQTADMWLPVTLSYDAFNQWIRHFLGRQIDQGWRPTDIKV